MAIATSIWIYWLLCLFATILIIANRKFAYKLLSSNLELSHQGKGYTISLILGWITTFMASISYILFTQKYEPGSYEISDLLVFSFSNGVLEQFMFIFWFLLGCYIAKLIVPSNPKLVFACGYISYATFSGFIHALFWMKVLPEHQPAILIMPPLLSIMSLVWMWLIWRYKAFIATITMHIIVDFLMIGHLHFTWFESFQPI
jgi:hypothetical protein